MFAFVGREEYNVGRERGAAGTEKDFVFAQAGYPCFLLDDDLNIVQANAAAQRLSCTPAMLRAQLSDTDLAALRCGQPVQMPWNHMPDMVYTLSILPLAEGYAAVVQPLASRPDGYRRMLEKAASSLSSMLVTLPTLLHFMDGDEQGVKLLEYSIRQGYRALRAAYDQHWCARLAAGDALELQTLELGDMLAKLCQAINTALPDAQVVFTGLQQPVYVRADRGLLEQIVCHVVNNAVLYGDEQRRVEVHLQRLANRAVVHVTDGGKGIQPQTAPHVFDAYYSCDPYCDTDETPGSGLGLYLVQQGLRAMGGECALESEFGSGTQLSFTLPLAQDDQPEVRAELADYLLDRFSCVYLHFCPLGARVWV